MMTPPANCTQSFYHNLPYHSTSLCGIPPLLDDYRFYLNTRRRSYTYLAQRGWTAWEAPALLYAGHSSAVIGAQFDGAYAALWLWDEAASASICVSDSSDVQLLCLGCANWWWSLRSMVSSPPRRRRRVLKLDPMCATSQTCRPGGRTQGVVNLHSAQRLLKNTITTDVGRSQCIVNYSYKHKIKSTLRQLLNTTLLLVIKPIRQYQRRDQAPRIDRVAHPRANDLRPAGPVCASHRHEIRHSLLVKVAREQGSDPGGAEEKDDMEETVVVLCCVALVVAWCLGGRLVLVFAV